MGKRQTIISDYGHEYLYSAEYIEGPIGSDLKGARELRGEGEEWPYKKPITVPVGNPYHHTGSKETMFPQTEAPATKFGAPR